MLRRTLVHRVAQLLLFFAAIALFVALLDHVGWAQIAQALTGVGVGAAVAIGLLGLLESMSDAVSLSAASRGMALPRAMSTNSGGALLNLLLPWDLGEVAKAALVRDTRGGVSGVIIWNYAYKLSRPVVSTTAAMVALLVGTGFAEGLVRAVLVANLLGFVPYLALKLVLHSGAVSKTAHALGRWRWFQTSNLLSRVAEMDAAVRNLWRERPLAYATVVGGQMLARTAAGAAFFLAMRNLRVEAGVGRTLLLYAAINVAEYLSSVVPARLGVTEGAAYVIFKGFGLPPEAGVVVYLVMRLKTLVSNLVAGGLGGVLSRVA